MATAAAASLPWLVCDHGDEERATTLYSVSDGARRPCEEIDAELRGKRSWVTSDGWILVWDQATLATFLWNPRAAAAPERQTKNKIALQAWASPPVAGTGCALSDVPTDCCTVVVLESSDTALWYCHVNDGSTSPSPWARYVYDVGGVFAPWDESVFAKRYAPPLAAWRGRFYCDVSSDEYGVLEFSPDPGMTVVKMTGPAEVAPPPGEQWTRPFTYTLDLDGELHTACIVFLGSDAEAETVVVEFAVYRVDIAGKRCVRVDSIGDRAILAGGSNICFAGWCPATEYGLLPNCVYWVHPYDDGRLHVYDVGANTEEVRISARVPGTSRLAAQHSGLFHHTHE